MTPRLVRGIVCVSLCALGFAPLAWAGDAVEEYLAEHDREMGRSPRRTIDVPSVSHFSTPPMEMRPYEPIPEEPRRSQRPPWLQPADRMAPMSADESRRLFCVAPNDCWFDPR